MASRRVFKQICNANGGGKCYRAKDGLVVDRVAVMHDADGVGIERRRVMAWYRDVLGPGKERVEHDDDKERDDGRAIGDMKARREVVEEPYAR